MNAFIVYDTFALACKANAVLQRAAAKVNQPFEWNIVPCRTQLLRFEPEAELALVEACDAHLVVFAWHERRPCFSWVKAWLENWARRRKVADAAIAVLGEGGGRLPEGFRQLAECASKHGLTFLPERIAEASNSQEALVDSHLVLVPARLRAAGIPTRAA